MERGISNASFRGNYDLIWEDIKTYTLVAFRSLIVNFNVVAASISLSPQNFTPIPHRIAFGILQLSKTTTFCLFEVYIINAKSACSPFVSDLWRLTNEIRGGFLQVHLAGWGHLGASTKPAIWGSLLKFLSRGWQSLRICSPLHFIWKSSLGQWFLHIMHIQSDPSLEIDWPELDAWISETVFSHLSLIGPQWNLTPPLAPHHHSTRESGSLQTTGQVLSWPRSDSPSPRGSRYIYICHRRTSSSSQKSNITTQHILSSLLLFFSHICLTSSSFITWLLPPLS